MNALAGFIVSGRWQALLVTTASGIVAFMLPPFSSVLNYLGAAAVALVTLHLGLMQGLQTLLAASALTLLFYQLAGIQSAVVLVLVLLLLLVSLLAGQRGAAPDAEPGPCAEDGHCAGDQPVVDGVRGLW